MRKYLFEFITIVLSITAAFSLDLWRDKMNEQEETQKALTYIKLDLQRDTSLYNYRLKLIERNTSFLEIGMTGQTPSLADFKKIHKGLRSAVEYKVYDFGYNYLANNITKPTVKNDTLLMWIGYYYSLSGPEGNYGRYNAEYWKLTGTNYEKLFEIFPNFFSPDTIVVNNEIKANIESFTSSKYWQGRIRYTHRENRDLITSIFKKNKKFAEDILALLEEEF